MGNNRDDGTSKNCTQSGDVDSSTVNSSSPNEKCTTGEVHSQAEPLFVSNEEKGSENAQLDDFYQMGKYTYTVCLFAELLILAQAGNMLYMMYAGAAPILSSCGTREFQDNETAKYRCDFVTQFQQTDQKSGANTNEWNCSQPELEAQFISVNKEFNYFCDRTKLVKQSISIQMIGVIVGSVIFGSLSDLFGRRKIMLVALSLCIACMLCSSFTDGLFTFTIWRFLVNVFNGGTMVILMVFTTEHYPKDRRFCLTNIITWSPNFVIFGIIAWICGDWRSLTRASAILAMPCLAILFYLSESPRWLIQKQRFADANKAIIRMFRINGHSPHELLIEQVLQREENRVLTAKQKTKHYNYLHLFYTWKFVRYTVSVAFSFLVVSLMNYSLIFNMEKLSGSIYMNSILMGLFRYSMNLTSACIDLKFPRLGRKFVHFAADALSAFALAIFVLVYISGLHEGALSWLSRASVLSVIGFCSLLFTTNGVMSTELFPTGIRNTSFSFGQVLTRIGVVLSPQIFFLQDFWIPLPHLTMCILAIVDAFLFQFNVIETKGRPLQEHFPSKEQRIFYKGPKSVELLPRGTNNLKAEDLEQQVIQEEK